jgi:putative FmdB family regulatory protein
LPSLTDVRFHTVFKVFLAHFRLATCKLLWCLYDDITMPLYEYELCEGNCVVCGGKFTLRRPLDAKELTNCPACKKPVRKVFSTFNSPKKLSISDAKKAGFTVLKKVGKGEYERQ